MQDLVPPLRRDIVVEDLADGIALLDPVFGLRIRLDHRGAEVVRALDRPQSSTALGERLSMAPEALQRVLGNFRRHDLLETEAARAAVGAVQATENHAAEPAASLPLIMRADARFSCTMCGSCCGGHNVGPVQPDVLAALEPHKEALARRVRSEKGLFFSVPATLGGTDAPTVMCQSEGGSCVFLDDDARCIIHADHGADMKPRACRLFPYRFVATPEGVVVTISEECRGFAEARRGKALRDDEPAIRRLLALVPRRQQVPKRHVLAPGVALEWPDYLDLEQRLHDAVDAAPDHGAALLAMRQTIGGGSGDGDPAELRQAMGRFCDQLTDLLGQLQTAMADATDTYVIQLDSLGQFELGVRTLRTHLRRALLPLPAPLHALFVDLMHHRLMSKYLVDGDSVADQFARLALGWLVSRSLMIERARMVKRRHLVAQDVSDAVVVTSFVLRSEVLGKALEPFAAPMRALFFTRLQPLLAHAEAMSEPDRRVDLYRF